MRPLWSSHTWDPAGAPNGDASKLALTLRTQRQAPERTHHRILQNYLESLSFSSSRAPVPKHSIAEKRRSATTSRSSPIKLRRQHPELLRLHATVLDAIELVSAGDKGALAPSDRAAAHDEQLTASPNSSTWNSKSPARDAAQVVRGKLQN